LSLAANFGSKGKGFRAADHRISKRLTRNSFNHKPMKKLTLITLALTCTAGAFAQGTVIFNNRVIGTVVTHVYGPRASSVTASQIGNGPNDTVAGTTDWTGYTLIGTTGGLGAATTFTTLLSANGANVPENLLLPVSQTTTFRTGGAAGNVTGITATLGNVPADAAAATVEMVAWDNSSGLYPTWAQASLAWSFGLIAAGNSGPLNVFAIGGTQNSAPSLVGLQSFNIHIIAPEPTSFSLIGLGAAAMLIFRRRKQQGG
jgi:hypothetical protein